MHKLKKRGFIDMETLVIILMIIAILVFFFYAIGGAANVLPKP